MHDIGSGVSNRNNPHSKHIHCGQYIIIVPFNCNEFYLSFCVCRVFNKKFSSSKLSK